MVHLLFHRMVLCLARSNTNQMILLDLLISSKILTYVLLGLNSFGTYAMRGGYCLADKKHMNFLMDQVEGKALW